MLDYSPAELLDIAHAMVLDPEGRILFWTRGTEQMYGWTSAEAVGHVAHELLRTHFTVPLDEIKARLFDGGEWQGELAHARRDGARIVVASHWVLHRDKQGRPAAILEVNNDISGVARAEEALRESEGRYQALVELSPDAIVVHREGRITFINSSGARLLRAPGPEAVVGREVLDFVHPDFHDAVGERLRLLGEGGLVSPAEMRFVRLDGTDIYGEIVSVPLVYQGRPAVQAVIRDITERRRAEEMFRLAVESAPNAMVMADEAGLIVLVNSQAERLFGYAREELIGRPVELLVPERFRAPHPGYRRGFSASPQVRAMGAGRDLFGLRKDGTEVPVEIGLNPIRTEKGGLVLSSIVDITERKRAERERERLLNMEQEARRQAEEANRMKDEFLATVSHELRTPLTSILGWSRMLREGMVAPEESARALETIERNARAQAEIVNDILEVSRIITGKLRLDVRQVRPAQAVEAAIAAVRPAAEAKGIRLISSLDLWAGPVMGDHDRLQQVAWNLLSNAIKFTPEGGRVEVRLEEANGHVRLTVSDTGIGIRPDFLPYVFDRFRQADSSATRSYGGLGLGLSIVRYLVELHGGRVSAESEGEDRGAAFTVTLPLAHSGDTCAAPAKDPVREQARAREQPPGGDFPRLNGLRVLVVEDEEDTRELVGMVLARCGAEVRTASSAPEAFELYESWRPDVMVCDIGLPEEDGYAFLRRVRSAEAGLKQTPAVALTGYARADDLERALAAGYQEHLPKPSDPVEVASAVARLAGQSS